MNSRVSDFLSWSDCEPLFPIPGMPSRIIGNLLCTSHDCFHGVNEGVNEVSWTLGEGQCSRPSQQMLLPGTTSPHTPYTPHTPRCVVVRRVGVKKVCECVNKCGFFVFFVFQNPEVYKVQLSNITAQFL